MSEKAKIGTGLIIFIVLMTVPFWYNAAFGGEGRRPELQKAAVGAECILPTEQMRERHMELLNTWRDEYVREGKPYVLDARGQPRVWPDGQPMLKSLSKTCLGCHQDKSQFCDRCHTYAAVDPYCWDCHVLPK
jgi:hypothetical protein